MFYVSADIKKKQTLDIWKSKIDTIVIVKIVKDYTTRNIKEFIEKGRKMEKEIIKVIRTDKGIKLTVKQGVAGNDVIHSALMLLKQYLQEKTLFQ